MDLYVKVLATFMQHHVLTEVFIMSIYSHYAGLNPESGGIAGANQRFSKCRGGLSFGCFKSSKANYVESIAIAYTYI